MVISELLVEFDLYDTEGLTVAPYLVGWFMVLFQVGILFLPTEKRCSR